MKRLMSHKLELDRGAIPFAASAAHHGSSSMAVN